MATVFLFRCPGCRYKVRSSGRPAARMRSCTTAIACETCKEVMDAVTHSASLGNHPPRAGDPGVAPRCKVDPAHKVVLWGEPHPCPKCGKGMERDPDDVICAD